MPEVCETLVVFASPHKNGFTSRLLNRFLKENSIENYYLFDCFKEMPLPCIGCNKCESEFTCSQPDLKEFGRVFRQCSRIVIATPIYNGSLPAPLKALADRNQIYYSARFSRGERGLAAPKQAAVLLTCGSPLDKTNSILDILLPIFSVTSTTLIGSCIWAGTDSNAPQPKEIPIFK